MPLSQSPLFSYLRSLRTCAYMFNSLRICAQSLMSSYGYGNFSIILVKNSLKGFQNIMGLSSKF